MASTNISFNVLKKNGLSCLVIVFGDNFSSKDGQTETGCPDSGWQSAGSFASCRYLRFPFHYALCKAVAPARSSRTESRTGQVPSFQLQKVDDFRFRF